MSAAVAETEQQANSSAVRSLTFDVGWIPLSIVNAYIVGPPGAVSGNWVLVDAGLSISANAIVRAAEQWAGPNSKPKAIVLTHGHFDHVGALKALAEWWDVPIFAHRLEMPYITGQSSYPPPDPSVGGGMMAYSSPLYSRGPIDLGQRAGPLPGDGTVPGMAGWRWVHTPGHTPGHVSFFRDSDHFLIVGDAFVTTRQESALSAMTGKPTRVHRPPAYFTSDWHAARNSVQSLARLKPEYAATGHGFPMWGESMRQQLDELAGNFDRVAVPSHGRYVSQPARADERGVTFVPPMPAALTLGGMACATAAGFALGLLTKRR